MSVANLFDHTARVMRGTQTTDALADVRRAWGEVAREPMALVPPRTPLRMGAAGEVPVGVIEGFARASADIRLGDVLDVVAGPEQGRRFRVLARYRPRGRHTEVICEPYTGSL